MRDELLRLRRRRGEDRRRGQGGNERRDIGIGSKRLVEWERGNSRGRRGGLKRQIQRGKCQFGGKTKFKRERHIIGNRGGSTFGKHGSSWRKRRKGTKVVFDQLTRMMLWRKRHRGRIITNGWLEIEKCRK